MCPELPYGFARLDEQRLVVTERAELTKDDIEALPVPCGLPRTSIHDEILRTLGDVGIEVVAEHPQRSFLDPTFARELVAARSTHDT